jgi:hypothetical protein
MFARLDEDNIIVIKNIEDQASFYCYLPVLLSEENCVIGLACYDPVEQLALWLRSLPYLSVSRRFDYRQVIEVASEDYPLAGAYYLYATRENLLKLTEFARVIPNDRAFANSIIGFKNNKALFSFHDAFANPDFFVSPSIPRTQIQKFCEALKVDWKLIPNPDKE